MFAIAAFAQESTPQLDAFKKEAKGLQSAVNDVASASVSANGVLQPAKTTYLDGFGIVVTVEVSLAPTRTPFSGPESPEAVRKLVNERKDTIRQKFESLLQQRAVSLESIGTNESVALVLYLFNANPVDLPKLPAQIVFTAKKLDPTHVTIREY